MVDLPRLPLCLLGPHPVDQSVQQHLNPGNHLSKKNHIFSSLAICHLWCLVLVRLLFFRIQGLVIEQILQRWCSLFGSFV